MSRPSEPSMSLGWMDSTNVTVFVIRANSARGGATQSNSPQSQKAEL
jgi:hypothetical protein